MKRLVCITLGWAVLGCGPAVIVPEDEGTESGSSSESGSVTTGVTTGVTTSPTTATTTPPPPGTGTSPQPTTSTPTTTPTTATDPTFGDSSSGFWGSSGSGGPIGLPDGSDCVNNFDCASGRCYVTGIGGICGECSSDADCDFGCTGPNPLSNPPQGSVCNDGGLGQGCETGDACPGLECVEIVDVPGILTVSTCGECNLDNDCTPGMVCDIDVDLPNLTGVWTCVGPGSQGLGEFCAFEGSGDTACLSGHCATASLKGLIDFGVCSECEVNGDCMPGQACVPPELGLDGTINPGFCE